ncbi:MAG: polysaccharide biosynthesis tyrosine autokinase [Bacteroidales bacterium]|nr:polysaccharide biosynthesis tyrosine autokinase [Bacteroidales bacterium]
MADELDNTWSAQDDSDEKLFSLRDIWALFWGHKWWYVLSLIVALAIAFFYLYRTPKLYQSSEKIIIETDQSADVLSDMSASMRRRSAYGQNVANEIIAFKSSDLMTKAVERLGLETNYTDLMFLRERELYNKTPFFLSVLGDDNLASSFSFVVRKHDKSSFILDSFTVGGVEMEAKPVIGTFGDSLVTPVGSVRLTESQYFHTWGDDIRISWANARNRAAYYAGRMGVTAPRDESSVVTLTMTDYSPERAKNVLATVLDIYNEQWVENKNRAAANTSEFIAERLTILQQELGDIDNDIKVYKQQNRITDVGAVSGQYLSESSAYSEKAFANSNQLAISQMIRDRLTDPTRNSTLLPANSGLTNANIEGQISEYNATLMKRDKYLKESSEANPMVADLNANLDAMKANITRSIDNNISALQLQQDKILAQEGAILGKLSSTTGQALELQSMSRDQKVKESLYIYLLQKREENELATQLNVSNNRLIQSATNGVPISPVAKKIYLIALLLGLGIPFAIFFLRILFNTTVRTRADVSKLKVPFLAEIPQMGLEKKGFFDFHKVNRYDEKSCKIMVQQGKRDVVNEAFRVLRTNLDMMTGYTDGCHVVMVTSFNPNAGKTFTTMNMAASMAVKGSKVLLLDLDLRKASLSKALGVKGSGVASFLNGRADDYHPHIQTVADNLSVLPVGSLPPNPAELLVSDKFKQMVESMRKEYDYIFMDCPPIDIVADTSIISKSADITVFIIRAGLFDKQALPALDELYISNRYSRMAFILNGVERMQGTYGQHYGSGSYGYGYGSYGYGKGHGYGYGYGSYGEQDGEDGKKKKKGKD